jgi:hypothetical protein
MYHPMVALVTIALFVACLSKPAKAEEPPAPNGSRNFYKVLDEVLSDFEYDLKSGQVMGLKDLAVRNIATSENVPASFKAHLELLLTERILKTTKARIVHCNACRAKRTTLDGQSVVISSADSNSAEMNRIAKMNGIQNFMDVAFAYQPAGMMLSIQISDADTGTTLWTRSYNSDSSRASAQRRGVDYQEIDEAKTKMEYQPLLQNRPSLSVVMAPKAGSGLVTLLAVGYRMMERYDNRHKEVGFEMNYYLNPGIITGTKADPANIWSGVNLTMLFRHAWGLFGDEENYNQSRGVFGIGIGGSYASGFLGALIRPDYELRFAKHWSASAFLGYRPAATVLISGTATSLSGVEGGIGVGYLY